MRNHGETELSPVSRKLPQWRLFVLLLLLVPSLLAAGHPAKADWWDPFPGNATYPPGTNHGADYMGAACAQMFEDYQVNCQTSLGFAYNWGQPVTFQVLWTDPPRPELSGYSTNVCSAGQIHTITGCAVEADQQGCSFASDSPNTS